MKGFPQLFASIFKGSTCLANKGGHEDIIEKKKDEKHARFHDPYGYLKSLSFDSCGNPTPRTRKDLKEIFKIQQVATDRLDTNEYDDQFHHLRVRQVICSMLLYDQAQRLLDFRNICKNERFRIQRPGRDMVSFLENEESVCTFNVRSKYEYTKKRERTLGSR